MGAGLNSNICYIVNDISLEVWGKCTWLFDFLTNKNI